MPQLPPVSAQPPRRTPNPQDIVLPQGFAIDVSADGLNCPINLTFTERGEMLVADAGMTDGNGKVLRRTAGGFEVLADGFRPPLTGITYRERRIYVAHRGSITLLDENGGKTDILSGLPSKGDHHNNRVVFGADGWMYFGQGTATNSGVVGEDNDWVREHPFFCDAPGSTVALTGFNGATANMLSAAHEQVLTGAFRPYRVPTVPGETVSGSTFAAGSILRARPDGSQLQLVAWGLRNPFRIRFDRQGRLFAANHGMDVRGSRPVRNSPDEFRLIRYGEWYGWPDYTGGYPVTMPVFKPAAGPQPSFLLARHPMRPPMPVANFTPHSATMGFDFIADPAFGPVGDVLIAEFGSGEPEHPGGAPGTAVGRRVSRIDMRTGAITPFAMNRSGQAASATGGGGFERPIDVVFGPDGSLYIVDFGGFRPGMGVIWRITRHR